MVHNSQPGSLPRLWKSMGSLTLWQAPNIHKQILEKATDTYQALMAYHVTPLEACISPAELLMGRKVHTRLPTMPTLLILRWSYLEQFCEKDGSLKARQKENFDRHHAAGPLPVITPREHVWLPDEKIAGTVVHESGTPNSYTVKMTNGLLWRNRGLWTVFQTGRLLDRCATPPSGGKGNPSMHPPAPAATIKTTQRVHQIRLPECFRDQLLWSFC